VWSYLEPPTITWSNHSLKTPFLDLSATLFDSPSSQTPIKNVRFCARLVGVVEKSPSHSTLQCKATAASARLKASYLYFVPGSFDHSTCALSLSSSTTTTAPTALWSLLTCSNYRLHLVNPSISYYLPFSCSTITNDNNKSKWSIALASFNTHNINKQILFAKDYIERIRIYLTNNSNNKNCDTISYKVVIAHLDMLVAILN